MADMSAEKFAQRVFDLNLLDSQQVEAAWSEFGSRNVSFEDFCSLVVRKGWLTNFQVDRVLRGERTGYLYGDYKVLYLIGAGTFARVYRAVHTGTGRIVAVKVLRKRYRENLLETEQFLREGRMGMKLRHLNVVPIYDVHADPLAPFMVMEFVEGQTLRDLVRIRKKLEPEVAISLLTDVAAGLVHAAEQGITHRDLKLSNVLVTSRGRAKLVDFGLAAAASDLSDDALADCPNARAIDYAALERGTGVRKDDLRSDIFFAGCILYTMLSGRPPMYETKDRIQRLNFTRFREIKPITELEPDLPHSVSAVVYKAMELDPERRFARPGELLAELKKVSARLAAGDTSSEGPAQQANRAAAAAAAAEAIPGTLEGGSRTVMIVESKNEMQDVLRKQLKRRGYRVLIISDPGRALGRFEDGEQVADCVVFCTTELGMAAVEAFNRFGSDPQTKELPAILFADHKQKDLLEAAQPAEHRPILSMPIQVKQLRAMLLKLLPPQVEQS